MFVFNEQTLNFKSLRPIVVRHNRSEQKLLCCNAFISVMKATELWNCDNLSNAQRLSRQRTFAWRGLSGFSIHCAPQKVYARFTPPFFQANTHGGVLPEWQRFEPRGQQEYDGDERSPAQEDLMP
jgi:hypothetical protein